MPCDPNFKSTLDKLIRVRIQELRDGCIDCREANKKHKGGMCREHEDIAEEMGEHPRKYFLFKNGKWSEIKQSL
jgi:hypothetical protein